MHILYLSVHSILEYLEVSMLIENGHNVFSHGAYIYQKGHISLPRPGIENPQSYPQLEQLAREYPKTELPSEMIEWADVIIAMHEPQFLIQNWPRIKHKKIVWRTIGQSLPSIERMLKPLRDEGLKIVRYSPKEKNMQDFLGEDALIRFPEDPVDLADWNGNSKRVINISQSLKGRGKMCHYDHVLEMMAGFPSKVFGPANDDLGALNGGAISYDLLKGQLRDSRVYVYGGTWPASYTLSFIEAWMTGIPIVAIGKKMAENIPSEEHFDFYEIPDLIKNGVNGFISDDMGELRSYIKQLLDNDELAHRIGQAGRASAIEIFGKPRIRSAWKVFLESL